MKASCIKFQKTESTCTFLSAHDIKAYGGIAGIAPRIGKLDIRWRLSASILPALFPGNGTRYPLNIRTRGHHSRYGGFGEERKK